MDVSHRLSKRLGEFLKQRKLRLVTAESCTGGWVAQVVTSIPGSSGWFERGYVTYSNASKHDLLGVNLRTLDKFGSVSEACVREMAEGALQHSEADVSIAITGIAGPDGGLPTKPVGSVWMAWAGKGHETRARFGHFVGDREMVRQQAVMSSLQGLMDFLEPESDAD